MKENTLESELTADFNALAKKIRDYSRSQNKLWRKVPYLALQADTGAIGSSRIYQLAYMHGYWKPDNYAVAIDLLDGEIVSPIIRLKKKVNPAPNILVVSLIDDLNMINAGSIIKDLERKASEKDPPYRGDDFRTNDEWRKSLIKEFGITENYSGNRNADKLTFKESMDIFWDKFWDKHHERFEK